MATELSEMKLVELEEIIDRGLASFVEVGNALIEIRDAKMYGSEYATFEEYCDKRFGFTRQRAYQLIAATKTVREMSTRVGADEVPTSEMQARVLNSVADTPARKAKILKKAAKGAPKDANGKPQMSVAVIKKAAGIASDPEADRRDAILGKRSSRPPSREPGDESETEPQSFKIQRSKTIKTVEALMRAFDDLHGMQSHRMQHAEAIASCKILLKMAKDWSCK